MVDRSHDLPLKRQAEVLGLSRGRLYYQPRRVSAAELAIMRQFDKLHLNDPFAGSLRHSAPGGGRMIFAAARGASFRSGYALPP